MFQISPDQTQWVHLYRVPKVCPITFVIFCCDEFNDGENSSRVLDLRIVSNAQNMMGSSWCARSGDNHKLINRAECTKFLELRAKFMIANATTRSVDEVELVEASADELSLAVSLDEGLKNNLSGVVPTLYSRLARSVLASLNVNYSGVAFEELTDWRDRNAEAIVIEAAPIPEPAPVVKHYTTKTQKVPI